MFLFLLICKERKDILVETKVDGLQKEEYRIEEQVDCIVKEIYRVIKEECHFQK